MTSYRIVIFIVGFLATKTAVGQSLFNNGYTISIGPSDVLFVTDTIVNNGTIINNGDMQVGGSWINNSEYDAGQGQITFNSDLPQVINHNDQAFARLTISGGGEKIFSANITIENELNLAGGILASQNNARIIFSPNALISGGSDDTHIRGPVYHQGDGAKLYPVGNGSQYLPLTLLNVEGTNAEVGVEEVDLDGDILQKAGALQKISTKRYWQLDVVSGSVANSQVVLSVRDENITPDEHELVVAQSPAIDGNFQSMGQAHFDGSVMDGMLTSNGVVTMPVLAVGSETTNGQIIVYNAVSANGDDKNDYLMIENIENYPENKFTLFNRWGDKIFEIENYDNHENVFRGKSNTNGEKDLVDGTYFYVIETKKDHLKINGFLSVKN